MELTEIELMDLDSGTGYIVSITFTVTTRTVAGALCACYEQHKILKVARQETSHKHRRNIWNARKTPSAVNPIAMSVMDIAAGLQRCPAESAAAGKRTCAEPKLPLSSSFGPRTSFQVLQRLTPRRICPLPTGFPPFDNILRVMVVWRTVKDFVTFTSTIKTSLKTRVQRWGQVQDFRLPRPEL